MAKITDLQEYKNNSEAGIALEFICINCKYRFVGWMKEEDNMIDLLCPKCNKDGGIINTGESTDKIMRHMK